MVDGCTLFIPAGWRLEVDGGNGKAGRLLLLRLRQSLDDPYPCHFTYIAFRCIDLFQRLQAAACRSTKAIARPGGCCQSLHNAESHLSTKLTLTCDFG